MVNQFPPTNQKLDGTLKMVLAHRTYSYRFGTLYGRHEEVVASTLPNFGSSTGSTRVKGKRTMLLCLEFKTRLLYLYILKLRQYSITSDKQTI